MGKYWKKVTAFAVAAVMLFQAVPGVPSLVTTAEGADNSSIYDMYLTYTPECADDSSLTTASVVVGGNVSINEEKTHLSTVTAQTPPFALQAQIEGQINKDNFKNSQGTFVASESKDNKKSVTIKSAFDSLFLNDGIATLAVDGKYSANLENGRAYVNDIATSVTASPAIPILENSELVFEFSAGENETGGPTIGSSAISKKTGFFANVSRISVARGTEAVRRGFQNASDVPERKLVLLLELRTEGVSYSNLTVPAKIITPEPVNGGQPTYSNEIVRGTKIEISYMPPLSNTLHLTVYRPLYAINLIGADIVGHPDQFIEVTDKNLEDVQHIRNPIKVKTLESRYNEKFEVQWFWEPAKVNGQIPEQASSAIDLPLYKNLNDSNPGFGNFFGLEEVKVTQSYEDIKGNLVARVIFAGKSNDIVGVISGEHRDFPVPVVVKGTGQPPSVQQHGANITIGSSTSESGMELDNRGKQVPPSIKMDLYDGKFEDFPKIKDPLPYLYTLLLKMGKDNGAALYAKVECLSGEPDLVLFRADETSPIGGRIIAVGDEIINPSRTDREGEMFLQLLAQKVGTSTYQITYYVKDNKDNPIATVQGQTKFSVSVQDTSPEDDNALANIVLRDDSRSQIAFGFTPDMTEYNIDIPYAAKGFTLAPTIRGRKASDEVKIEITDKKGIPVSLDFAFIKSGRESPKILLPDDETYDVILTVTAQNKDTLSYKVSLRHLPPSDDATLSKLSILDTSGTELLTDFDPETPDYKLTVPFKTSEVQVLINPNHYGATFTTEPELEKRGLFGKAEWLTLNEPNDETPPTTLKIKVIPEDLSVDHYRYYTVEITREPPSSISTLDSLTVQDKEDKTLNYKPAFHKEMSTGDAYVVDTIPYTMDKVKLGAKPTEPNAKMEAVYTVNGKIVRQVFTAETTTKAISIPFIENEGDYFEITIEVTAENGVSKTSYPVHIVRNPPSEDSTLGSLKITDQDGADVAYDPVFATDTSSYTASVPYETEKVAVTLTPSYEGAKVKVNGRNVTAGEPSSLIKLPENKTTTITVQVIAENGKATQKYTIKIKRGKPSNDARLKSLTTTGTENWQPLFIPDVLDYTAEVTVGEKGVTITAIPNHAYATVKIDGKRVENGAASELIELMKVKQKIEIEVTAQDGKTKRVYTITFTDRNKIELTDNANLKSLKVIPGEMTPKFQPSVTYYDVAVKEDVSSVQIVPKAEDEYATIKVMAGSKEIGDWDNNYAQQIVDGENEFTITVTSASGKVTKEYQVLVHRNDNANMGTLTPLSPDDINFELTGDVIQVDITKYPRIEADVFNTIKEEYPEKTIVFQGNDYSLEFRGEDLDTIVPQTEIFDFSLSFTSPQKNDILDVLDQYPGNDEARIVYVYFDHHGALPGPATFTISLGTKYENDTMFWHYYNPERNRIDYYGSVKTNSKGTFAVRIDHMSTYLVADQRLVGSENKTAAVLDSSANVAATAGENLSAATSATKPNPSTGVGKEQE